MENNCQFCGKKFTKYKWFQKHLQNEHNFIPVDSTTSKCVNSIKLITQKQYLCVYCQRGFSRLYNMERHEKTCPIRISPVKNSTHLTETQQLETQIDSVRKQICNIEQNTNKRTQEQLDLESRTNNQKSHQQTDTFDLQQQFKLLQEEVAQMKKSITVNNINNQVLQVICVSNNDNYLDMLTKEWDDFDRALEYIKDCALSNLTGDCKLIKGKPLLNPFKQLKHMKGFKQIGGV